METKTKFKITAELGVLICTILILLMAPVAIFVSKSYLFALACLMWVFIGFNAYKAMKRNNEWSEIIVDDYETIKRLYNVIDEHKAALRAVINNEDNGEVKAGDKVVLINHKNAGQIVEVDRVLQTGSIVFNNEITPTFKKINTNKQKR